MPPVILRVKRSLERGAGGVANEVDPDASDADDEGTGRPLAKLSVEQLRALLRKREQQMQEGATGNGVTDQWRALLRVILGGACATGRVKLDRSGSRGILVKRGQVYSFITNSMAQGNYLRLMVQASAGTGPRPPLCVARHPPSFPSSP